MRSEACMMKTRIVTNVYVVKHNAQILLHSQNIGVDGDHLFFTCKANRHCVRKENENIQRVITPAIPLASRAHADAEIPDSQQGRHPIMHSC